MYDIVGGEAFFARLVDTFYDGVADDPVLLRLYPEAPDLTGARRRLRMFLPPGRKDVWPPRPATQVRR